MLPTRPAWLPAPDALGRFYGKTTAYPYYRLQLTEYISRLLPATGSCRVVDVGAGDGYLGAAMQTFRPDTAVVGVETQVREITHSGFHLVVFDGRRLPFPDGAFDLALLSNVLHHADDQPALLAEVCRVTRRRVIIKDHLCRSALDRWKLAALDVLGNWRFGADTRGDYLSPAEWALMFAALPGASVTWYDELSFRRGALARVFANDLEVIFALDLADRGPAAAQTQPATDGA